MNIATSSGDCDRRVFPLPPQTALTAYYAGYSSGCGLLFILAIGSKRGWIRRVRVAFLVGVLIRMLQTLRVLNLKGKSADGMCAYVLFRALSPACVTE